MLIQIRLFLKEYFDQGLNYSPVYLHHLKSVIYHKLECSMFMRITEINVPKFRLISGISVMKTRLGIRLV